jgi:RimJ/RimL family protein N-acetyltransferase
MQDADDMFSNWACSAAAAEHMLWSPSKTVDEVKDRISGWIDQYDKSNLFYQWAISLKASGKVIGSIMLHCISESNRSAEAAYVLGEKFWSNGYMTEALRAVIEYGIDRMGLNRIAADHFIANPASGRVMIKAGMKFEGIVRQKYYAKKGFADCAAYAILADDLHDSQHEAQR